MTTVDTTAPTTSTGTITQDQTTIDESIAAVLTMLSGKKHTSSELSEMKLSEDVLYAGLVYDSLLKDSPAAAKTFKQDLKRHFDARTKRSDSQPLAKSVQDVLNAAIKGRSISQKKVDTVVKDAFGHAQLDRHTGSLSRTAHKGGIDSFLKTVSANTAAKSATVNRFEAAIGKPGFIAPSIARKQRKELDKILASLKPKTETPKNPSSSTTTTTTTTNTTAETETNPNELVYDPVAKNGNIEVIIPLKYRSEVSGVTLLGESGKEILDLKKYGDLKDGRNSFKGDTTAVKLKDIHTMRLDFKDGTWIDFQVGSGDTRFVKQYMGE